MKKALLIFSFLVIFSTTSPAHAASSGACSGHNGVNCLAGHDTDGSVICNDGWKNSSVQYVDIKDVCMENYLEPGPFYDVTQTNPNRDAILDLYEQGVINGYPDSTFKPENEINRAELLKILVEGSGVTPDSNKYNGCFTDVLTDWYAPYVCYAKTVQWVDGYPDGTFKPAQTVNKVEAIKMLLNSQNITIPTTISEDPFLDVSKNEWFAPFIKVAKDMKILEENGNYLQPAEFMKRGSISENLYRLLQYEEKNNDNSSTKEPETQSGTEDHETIILNYCKTEWPDDTDMQEYCQEQQLESWKNLSNDQPNNVSNEQYSIIVNQCAEDWGNDYSMQEYCREQQFDGVTQINEPKPSHVTNEQYSIIVDQCTEDWENDYSMQAYCYEQQFEGIEKINNSTKSQATKNQCASDWPNDYSMQAYCLEQ